jgi:hypothetical protein
MTSTPRMPIMELLKKQQALSTLLSTQCQFENHRGAFQKATEVWICGFRYIWFNGQMNSVCRLFIHFNNTSIIEWLEKHEVPSTHCGFWIIWFNGTIHCFWIILVINGTLNCHLLTWFNWWQKYAAYHKVTSYALPSMHIAPTQLNGTAWGTLWVAESYSVSVISLLLNRHYGTECCMCYYY